MPNTRFTGTAISQSSPSARWRAACPDRPDSVNRHQPFAERLYEDINHRHQQVNADTSIPMPIRNHLPQLIGARHNASTVSLPPLMTYHTPTKRLCRVLIENSSSRDAARITKQSRSPPGNQTPVSEQKSSRRHFRLPGNVPGDKNYRAKLPRLRVNDSATPATSAGESSAAPLCRNSASALRRAFPPLLIFRA